MSSYNDSKLLRKGIYPYEWFDNISKFDETSLPPKSAFFSKLNNANISDEDFSFAQSVWAKYNCKNMGDYHDLYLSVDVLLLADIMESFRSLCLDIYKLDPCHYVSSPSLAFDAMLKHTSVELELLSDVDMYLFFEKGIRGRYSAITHRMATANNKYIDGFNPDLPSSYIMYLDANNLYGWAMSNPLPHSNFKWEDVSKYEEIIESDAVADRGYVLEVDLSYPSNLHEQHRDFPLAPHHLDIDYDMLSDYSKQFVNPNYKSSKLCQTFLPKTRYVIHFVNLKQYLAMGLKVDKVYRILSFNQSTWLASYINFNTEMRQAASTDFELNVIFLN